MVFLLIDIRHEPSANDKHMYSWIVENGFYPAIVATKLDKINRSQVQKHLKMIRNGLDVAEGTPIIPYSSVTKQGRDEVWELIEKYAQNM
jgi:GTP-binding protein